MLTCFDLSITDEEIDAGVLSGHYVLQAYATTHWLDHVKEGIRDDIGSADFMNLCHKIWRFLARRSNQNFDRKSAKEVAVLELRPLKKDHEDIYQELCYINSSLASELPESMKAPKKNSKAPPTLCISMGSDSFGHEIPKRNCKSVCDIFSTIFEMFPYIHNHSLNARLFYAGLHYPAIIRFPDYSLVFCVGCISSNLLG